MENTDKTVWEQISQTLRGHNIDVYPPSTKVGECTKEYVVVKADGAAQIGSFSSQSVYYTFMLYVPRNAYNQLERFKRIVKDIVSVDLSPMLMPTGQETPDFYDDTVKAHMVSITYRNSVRNPQL